MPFIMMTVILLIALLVCYAFVWYNNVTYPPTKEEMHVHISRRRKTARIRLNCGFRRLTTSAYKQKDGTYQCVITSKQEGIKFSPAVGTEDKMFMIRYLLTDVAEQNPDILMIELVA